MTTLLREVFKARLQELRKEYRVRYTLSTSTLQSLPSDGNLLGNMSRDISRMALDTNFDHAQEDNGGGNSQPPEVVEMMPRHSCTF